jgi:hypothetical protein
MMSSWRNVMCSGCPSGPQGELLGEGVSQTHVDRAFDLSLAQGGVDCSADVVDCHHLFDLTGGPIGDHQLGGVAESGMDYRIGLSG